MWWEQSEEGNPDQGVDREPEPLMWGETPADIIDDAIWQIQAVYLKDLGRLPSFGEIMAGLTYSTRALALPDRPEDSPSISAEDHRVIEENFYTATMGDMTIPTDIIEARRRIGRIINMMRAPFRKDVD